MFIKLLVLSLSFSSMASATSLIVDIPGAAPHTEMAEYVCQTDDVLKTKYFIDIDADGEILGQAGTKVIEMATENAYGYNFVPFMTTLKSVSRARCGVCDQIILYSPVDDDTLNVMIHFKTDSSGENAVATISRGVGPNGEALPYTIEYTDVSCYKNEVY